MPLVLLVFVSLLTEYLISLDVCTAGDCVFTPGREDVICTNTATSCTINCNAGQCEDQNIYLAASNENIIECDGDKACNKAKIYCGIPDTFPSGYNVSDFNGHINLCRFTFRNKASADSTTRVKCHSDLVDACFLRGYSDGETNFQKAEFNCYLPNGNCTIQCDDDKKACGKDTTSFNCDAPICNCVGIGCEFISINTQNPTTSPSLAPTLTPIMSPTNPTLIPTMHPSTSPAQTPSLAPTNPTSIPTNSPSFALVSTPTVPPSIAPSIMPSISPSVAPTDKQTTTSSSNTSYIPTKLPLKNLTNIPTQYPRYNLSYNPTLLPSFHPTLHPSLSPTTSNPTLDPPLEPTYKLTMQPILTSVFNTKFIVIGTTEEGQQNIDKSEPYFYIIIGAILICICSTLMILIFVIYSTKHSKAIQNKTNLQMVESVVSSSIVSSPSSIATIANDNNEKKKKQSKHKKKKKKKKKRKKKRSQACQGEDNFDDGDDIDNFDDGDVHIEGFEDDFVVSIQSTAGSRGSTLGGPTPGGSQPADGDIDVDDILLVEDQCDNKAQPVTMKSMHI